MNQAEQNLLVVNKKQQAGVIFTEARAPKTNEDAGNEVTWTGTAINNGEMENARIFFLEPTQFMRISTYKHNNIRM